MPTQFISESIRPVPGSIALEGMASAEPGLPRKFTWRGGEFTVEEVLDRWKESGPMKGGGREMYLRKHWFAIRTTDGREMKIYFDRQPASKRQLKKRWWLFTLDAPEESRA